MASRYVHMRACVHMCIHMRLSSAGYEVLGTLKCLLQRKPCISKHQVYIILNIRISSETILDFKTSLLGELSTYTPGLGACCSRAVHYWPSGTRTHISLDAHTPSTRQRAHSLVDSQRLGPGTFADLAGPSAGKQSGLEPRSVTSRLQNLPISPSKSEKHNFVNRKYDLILCSQQKIKTLRMWVPGEKKTVRYPELTAL